VTRIIWSEQEKNACLVPSSDIGHGVKPNCTARTKNAEGSWATYHYNECGYRGSTSCGPKPFGSVRIAIMGASVSQALFVTDDQTYFARTSSELSRLCHRTVDVQNLGSPGASPLFAYHRVDEALALKPDVVLYPIAPFDIEQQIDPKELLERNNSTRPPQKAAVHEPLSPLRRLQRILIDSRTVLVAQHFLFQNKDTYLRLYLNYGDKADFLRQPFTSAWQQRFADLSLLVGDAASKMRAAGVPFIVIPVPSRAEAALLSSQRLPPRVDPFAFGRQIEKIASDHGAGYVDLMEPFSRIPNSESLFYVVDGHVTPEGETVIAQSLIQKLQDGSVPAFSSCTLDHTVAGRSY
jgi:hypothetical protein